MGSTKKELITDLRSMPRSNARDELIERALAGHYHDFDTELPAPKIQLVLDLEEAGFAELAMHVKMGAYDDERPTEAQLADLQAIVRPEIFDALVSAPVGNAPTVAVSSLTARSVPFMSVLTDRDALFVSASNPGPDSYSADPPLPLGFLPPDEKS